MLSSVIINILSLIVTLGILVTFHEYGHYWVARRCGVKIEKFSIGFGRPLLQWRKGETIFQIAAIPLGGYVKMLGEQDEEIPAADRDRAFNAKPLAQRAAIVAAGPMANFVLAVLLYWLMFVSGVTDIAPIIGKIETDSPAAEAGLQKGDEIIAIDGDQTLTWQDVRFQLLGRLGESGNIDFEVSRTPGMPERSVSIPVQDWLVRVSEPALLESLGIREYRLDIPAELEEVLPGGSAAEAGLMPGDEILAVDGQAIDGWFDWVDIVRQSPGIELTIELLRSGRTETINLRPEPVLDEAGNTIGRVGAGVVPPAVMPEWPEAMVREVRYGPLLAIPNAFHETGKNIVFVFDSIKKMISGLISVENLSGPITIAQIAGQTVSYGLEYFLGFLAILSISLGVFNLLPVPMLDGGHLFYYAVEALIRRPVPEKIQAIGMQFGLILIAGIMLLVFYNDVNRLF